MKELAVLTLSVGMVGFGWFIASLIVEMAGKAVGL